jgi:hypothetical protein
MIAHLLLTKIYPEKSGRWSKMTFAFNRMIFCDKTKHKFRVTSRMYATNMRLARIASTNPSKETREKISRATTGHIAWNKGMKYTQEQKEQYGMFGRKHTEEAKRKISEKQKGVKRSPESVEKCAAAHRGLHNSEESRKRRSEKITGSKWMNKDGIPSFVNINDIQLKLSEGWKYGRGKSITGSKWISKEGQSLCVKIDKLEEYLKLGWSIGRLKELKDKVSKGKLGKKLGHQTEEHTRKRAESYSRNCQLRKMGILK